jgi:hypothetical protein
MLPEKAAPQYLTIPPENSARMEKTTPLEKAVPLKATAAHWVVEPFVQAITPTAA